MNNSIENKTLNDLSEEYVMDSVQLCEIINKYRKEENRDRTELQHYNLIKSIRAELEALENAGVGDDVNFYAISYIDSNNRKKPCFALTKFGVMQMLNKESAYVRYRTQVYIEELEYRNAVLEVPYTEMAEDRIKNGFNFKEIDSYLHTDYDNDYIENLSDIKSLGQFLNMGLYPYAALVKPFFDSTDTKYMDKLSASKEIKEDYGATTVTTKEFTDLLEKYSIPYELVSKKIHVEDIFVTKGTIKVMTNRSLLYLAMTVKGSEVAEAYRKFLIDNGLIELQQINQVTNEKDAKELHKLQIETRMMIDRLMKKEDRLNEKEDEIKKDKERLNDRENRLNKLEDELRKKEYVLNKYTVEDKGKPKLLKRIKKAIKILIGGDVDTHEYVIHEFESKEEDNTYKEPEKSIEPAEPIETIEAEIINSDGSAILAVETEEIVGVEYKPYDPPSATRKPICDKPIGQVQTTVATKVLTAKDVHTGQKKEELQEEFNELVKLIANSLNRHYGCVYNEAYKHLEQKFKNRSKYRKHYNGDSIIQRLNNNELREAIKFLKNKYPNIMPSEVKITNIKDLEVDKNNSNKK